MTINRTAALRAMIATQLSISYPLVLPGQTPYLTAGRSVKVDFYSIWDGHAT
jgi:hypothetical protein